MKKIDIEPESKVRILWEVSPNNYSKEEENNILNKFAIKYGISKNNIKIEPSFITLNSKGEEVAVTNEIVQNIQDPKFQQILFKKYLNENSIKDYDFNFIKSIDNLINRQINYDSYEKYRRYSIKWIKWSNFMSYGENNFFDFSKLKGLVLLNGIPENQSGKSTFCNDLIKFLLFGKISSRNRDWTLSDAFNIYKPEVTELYVEGCLTIDGEDYIINRTLTRPDIKRRNAKSKVVQKISYYKVVNNELLKLDDVENQEGSSNTQTNKIIKESIGNEKDFDLVICANSDNLKSLISLKDTERGRLLSRWVGLLPIEEKDRIARETFNKEIATKLLVGKYDKDILKHNNDDLLLANKSQTNELNKNIKLKNEIILEINDLEKEKERLLLSKKNIDSSISNIDITTVEKSLSELKDKLSLKKEEKIKNEKNLSLVKDIIFSEDNYKNYLDKDKKLSISLTLKIIECKSLKDEINTLKKSEYCPTCGAKLKNIDNSVIIAEKEKEFNLKVNQGIVLKAELTKIENEIKILEEKREKYLQKVKLELIIDTNSADIENLLHQIKEKSSLIDNLVKNKNIIEENNKIDLSLNIVNENIIAKNKYKDNIQHKIEEISNAINYNINIISQNNDLIDKINEDEIVSKNWKIYLDMIGKNGISKMVLRNALPLINGELKRLLNCVCDFDVEVLIDDDNNVSFYLIRDGIKSMLSSGSGFEQTCAGLALRIVLGNISTLPRPNYIILDEILGGVAEENYDKIQLLYNRIVTDYSFVFQITHLKEIIEWHDSIITVEKKNNISKII